MLKLYNSLGSELQTFKPIKAGEVRMYTCGPTVWNYAHIGNFRTFVFEDLLRRYLRFKGYKITQVMNITDVDDKIIKGIKESNRTLAEMTAFYEAAFTEDLATLNVERAEAYPRATAHVDEMVRLINVLLQKGYAYKSDDGSVYYDVSKFSKYGALSGVKVGSAKAGGRVSSDHYEEKKEAIDFALWKAWDADDGEVYWMTELGKGRPGWHIECSAMSMKYLGESFDIHTGAMDNKFPHHENEIAQSEASTGKKFVNYWLHSGMLTIKGEEMHKSVGNVVYLRDLLKDGWDPLTLRLFLISARYRDPTDLTEGALQQARAQRLRLQELVTRLRLAEGDAVGDFGPVKDLLDAFGNAMDDDLNTAEALGTLFTFAKKINGLLDTKGIGRGASSRVLDALARINLVLGIFDFKEEVLPPELAALLAKRDEARRKRNFGESDRLRDQLLTAGIAVEDTPAGTRWKRRARG